MGEWVNGGDGTKERKNERTIERLNERTTERKQAETVAELAKALISNF
jgi:hypothetical protein